MENSKKGYTLMMEKPDYRKSQGAKTPTEVQHMQSVPYASAIVVFSKILDDTKSQMGYVFVLNGGAVDWRSAKQSTTAMSSIEVEYIAVAEASMKAVWMRKLLMDLEVSCEMLCDNKPTLAIISISGRIDDIARLFVNGKKRMQIIGESSSPQKSLKITIRQQKVVEGEKYDDDSEDRLDPRIHKENPEHIDDDDDKDEDKVDKEEGVTPCLGGNTRRDGKESS
ncbi:hypothetical protein Tco_0002058 [Tanacetum coccineum]